jgi:hypothetical protein
MSTKVYGTAADKQRAYRARKYAEKFPDRVEKGVETEEPHPVYPWLKRWSDREYDKNGLVLKEQHCAVCNGVWSASVAIGCPYCALKAKRTV